MDQDACTIEGAHCEDCGSRELTIGPLGPVCDDCGGDLVNQDDCDGGHS